MRTRLFAAVLLVVVTVVALSATRQTAVREAVLPKPSPAELALDRVLPEVNLVDVTLEQAFDRLEAMGGVELLVDWQRLARPEGPLLNRVFDRKDRVALQAYNIPLWKALSRVLAQESDELGFAPDGKVVRISTRYALADRVRMRCYSLRGLLPPDDPTRPTREFFRTVPALVQTTLGRTPTEADHGQDLARFILHFVGQKSWGAGGALGEPHYVAGHLVVVQTWQVHREIEQLLANLRQAQVRHAAAPAAPVDCLSWDPASKQWLAGVPDPAERALRVVLPEVHIEGTSLEGAVQELVRLTRANIVLDRGWLSLNDERRRVLARRDTSLTSKVALHLREITLSEALRAVVRAYDDAVPGVTFTVDNGTILVTGDEVAEDITLTRVYDLRDWPQMNDDERPGLLEAIERHLLVEPNVALGGPVIRVCVIADRLVVTGTWRDQEKVRRFMDVMRAGPAKPISTLPATAPAGRGE